MRQQQTCMWQSKAFFAQNKRFFSALLCCYVGCRIKFFLTLKDFCGRLTVNRFATKKKKNSDCNLVWVEILRYWIKKLYIIKSSTFVQIQHILLPQDSHFMWQTFRHVNSHATTSLQLKREWESKAISRDPMFKRYFLWI